jgi:pimeloyl-ACP methyl ester carboxylesterase
MTRTIVFIHGAWVTPLCWERFIPFFEAKGYRCIAPAWPGKDRPIEAIRADPSPLAGLGVGEIVDHYAELIRGMDEPPILIGHSFGGLFTQILLDRGLGAAGVAIDSAPPRGIWAYEPTALRSLMTTLLHWRVWRKVVTWKYSNFRYAFVHTLSEADAHAAYDRHVTPETGRIFFQSSIATFDRSSPIAVAFSNGTRAPLLLLAGAKDRIVPPVINRRNFKAYAKSPARTDFHEFPDRTHWIIAQDGWDEVAGFTADWLVGLGLDPLGLDPGGLEPVT